MDKKIESREPFVKLYQKRYFAICKKTDTLSEKEAILPDLKQKIEGYTKKISDRIERIVARLELYKEYKEDYLNNLKEEENYLLSQKEFLLTKSLKKKQFSILTAEEYADEVLQSAMEKFKNTQRLQYREKRENLKRQYKAQKGENLSNEDISKYNLQLKKLSDEANEAVEQYRAMLVKSAQAEFGDAQKNEKEQNSANFSYEKAKAQQIFLDYNFKLSRQFFKRKERFLQKTDAEISRLSNTLSSLKNLHQKFLALDKVGESHLKDDVVLSVKNLCMYFGGLKAIDGLSFDVKKGEIFGLIGPNGAGKTTVFNCITQFYKSTEGKIFFKTKSEKNICLNKEKVFDVVTLGIARTFQNVEVVREVSVLDNLLIAAHRQYHSNFFEQALHLPIFKIEEKVIKNRAYKVLDFMNLSQYANQLAWGLPYGILKKIEIARTLMCNPQLIILDEPAAGLNESETAELNKIIRDIQQQYNSTILLVEHDMGLVMEICDTICAISFGKLLAVGTPNEIQNNIDVQTAYLGINQKEESH